MATTTPTSGFGATIVGSTSTGTTNFRSITVAGITRNMLDISVHGTTNGWMEFAVSGLQDAGEFTIDALYEETTYTKFIAAVAAGTETWTITLSSDAGDSIFQVTGAVTSVGLVVPHDDVITYDITIKLSGVITYVGT